MIDIHPYRDALIAACVNLNDVQQFLYTHPGDPNGDASCEYAEEGLDQAARDYVAKLNGGSVQSYRYFSRGRKSHLVREERATVSGLHITFCGQTTFPLHTFYPIKTLSVAPTEMVGLCQLCLKSWKSKQKREQAEFILTGKVP